MSLTICLDNQPPQYSGNETLRGQVTLQCFKPIEVNEIRLTFSGVSEAKVQKVKGSVAPAGSYRSKCVLFEKDRVLAHPDGQFFNTGTYSWPFELQFPSHAEPRTKASNWAEATSFRSDENHPLPPTFAAKCEDALRKLDCTIAYRIHAQAFKPAGFMGKRSPYASEVLPLQFMPPLGKADVLDVENPERTSRHQKEQIFQLRSMLLLQEYRGRTLGIQKRLRSWFSPGQLPRFSFRVSFSCPTRMAQSTPLSCLLEITPLMEDSSVSLPPVILMQSLHITLVSRTSARSGPSLMGSLFGEVDERIEILSRASLDMAVSGMIDLTEKFGSLIFRPTDVSFGTFNVARTYRLCVVGRFECVGKVFDFQVPDLPVNITPGNNGARIQDPERILNDEILPSYTAFTPGSESIAYPEDTKGHNQTQG